MRTAAVIILVVFPLMTSCANYKTANSWEEIEFKNVGIICDSFVLEFIGHIVMWPDIADKNQQFNPPSFYHHKKNRKPAHLYTRNPYHWGTNNNQLSLFSIRDSSVVAKYSLLGYKENAVLIQEVKSGKKYDCEIHR